jgi:hypothetical protein
MTMPASCFGPSVAHPVTNSARLNAVTLKNIVFSCFRKIPAIILLQTTGTKNWGFHLRRALVSAQRERHNSRLGDTQ